MLIRACGGISKARISSSPRRPDVLSGECHPVYDTVPGPGGVVVGADAVGLLVRTGSGILRIRRLQRPGGKMLAAREFLRGFPMEAGVALPSRPMAPLVGTAPFKK